MADAGRADPRPTAASGVAAERRRRPVDAGRAAARRRVWARVQLARNVRRPHTLELLGAMADDVVELHGDRLVRRRRRPSSAASADIDGRRVVFVGHQKGAEVDENIRRNFGMPHPEGYRKAMRLLPPRRAAAACRSSPSSTRPARSPAPLRGARRGRGDRPLDPGHDAACARRSSPSSPARAARAARWPSRSATSCSRSRTRSTRSSARRAARASCGARPTTRSRPPWRCA